MGQFVGGKVDVPEPSLDQIVNATANLIYNAVPWNKAAQNWYLAAIKVGALGVKLVTPEYAPFVGRDDTGQQIAGIANEIQIIVLGVDAEDLIKAAGVRGFIRGVKNYFFGNEDGNTVITRTWYGDP